MESRAAVAASWKVVGILALGLALAGCGSNSKSILNPRAGAVDYQGTASVGDFLSITIDHQAGTLAYHNDSNGLSGVATFTVAPDGSLSISDPSGNFVTGYEIPGYALALEALRTGPDRSTRSLVFAILKEPIRLSDTQGAAAYNYMQFRTRGGGLELGSSVLDGAGNIVVEGHGPMASAFGRESFGHDVSGLDMFQEDSLGRYLFVQAPGEDAKTYVFRTQGGFFAVDTPNGSHICLKQHVSTQMSSSWAGTYGTILYRKDNAYQDGDYMEHGEVSIDRVTVTVGPGGTISVTGAGADTIVAGQLIPVADNPDLFGPGKFQNPCPGLFSLSLDTVRGREELYAMFVDRAILLGSFLHDPETIQETGRYAYFYGAGLKR